MDNLLAAFSKNSLLWGLTLILIVAACYALRAVLGYRHVSQDARDDFAYKCRENMVDPRLNEASYVRAYKRFHAPRAQVYMALAMGAIALLTFPTLGILNFIFFKLWEWGGKSETFAPGFLVHSLSIFFMVIFFWALIAYSAARRYHQTTPISFRDELIREMD
ncbi:MAG: hypothetical protein ACPGVT_01590 [Maricaulaceae bacterium]